MVTPNGKMSEEYDFHALRDQLLVLKNLRSGDKLSVSSTGTVALDPPGSGQTLRRTLRGDSRAYTVGAVQDLSIRTLHAASSSSLPSHIAWATLCEEVVRGLLNLAGTYRHGEHDKSTADAISRTSSVFAVAAQLLRPTTEEVLLPEVTPVIKSSTRDVATSTCSTDAKVPEVKPVIH